MLRACATGTLLAAVLLFSTVSGAEAQTVDNPLLPRGSLFFRMDPSATTTKGIYTSGEAGDTPLGGAFDGLTLDNGRILALEPVADRFGSLAGATGAPSITLGTTRAHFSADEKVVPLDLSYGILDRLTVGVTVPIIKRRLDTALRLTSEGADVGLNPASEGTDVNEFLTGAESALGTVRTAVEDTCTANGEQDADCVAGRALVDDADAFLTGLGDAYDEESVFPLAGTPLGDGITSRWTGYADAFTAWGAEGPAAPPLATAAVDQAAFESLVVDPAWPLGGFPVEQTPFVMGLGDIELHAAVGLLRANPSPSPRERERLRVNASVVGSMRFATGSPDSLRTTSPADPPRGVSGFTLGAVADVMLPGRFAVLGRVEGGWNGTREMTLLAPDPESLFTPGRTRAQVRWTPGSHLRASITPRYRVIEGLSLGLGWRILRRQPDAFESIDTEDNIFGPIFPSPDAVYTQQSLAFELRYVALDEPLASGVPFPFELLLRASRSFTGSEGAPVDTRAEAMVRLRLWHRD